MSVYFLIDKGCIITSMETLKPKQVTLDIVHFIGSRLLDSGWAKLGDTYGEAVGGYEPHKFTIPPPNNVLPFPEVA